MISRLVELEQQRLSSLGYGYVTTPISISVSTSLQNLCIGNDTYILTNIRIGNTDVMDDSHIVCIASATDGLTATEHEIALMGQSIYRTFRNFIIIRTMNRDTDWTDSDTIPTYTLDFIKITPTKKL